MNIKRNTIALFINFTSTAKLHLSIESFKVNQRDTRHKSIFSGKTNFWPDDEGHNNRTLFQVNLIKKFFLCYFWHRVPFQSHAPPD